MTTSSLPTYNYLVPANGTTHAVFAAYDFAVAGTGAEDWTAFAQNHFRFRPQGCFIDNTAGTAPAILSIQGIPFKAVMPAGYAGWVSFPSCANLVTQLSGTGTVQLTYVDYPVINSAPVSASGNPASGNVAVTNPVSTPVYSQPVNNGVAVSATNPLPITPGSGPITDGSGTITTANTSQQIFAANTARRYLLIQNPSSSPLYFNFDAAATIGIPSLMLSTGSSYEMSGFVSSDAINIICANVNAPFVAKEG